MKNISAHAPAVKLSRQGNPLPLYAQLKDHLQQRVNKGEFFPGSRFPSEFEIKTQYGVSRITVVRAVKELVKERVLKRHQGQGTFVVHAPAFEPHPFVRSLGVQPKAPNKVRVALFENMPAQQKVWTRLINLFNRTHPELCLDIEWLPTVVNTLELYKEFIHTRRLDVVQLTYPLARQLQAEGYLAQLPGDLAGSLRGKAYHTSLQGSDAGRLLSWVVPLHFSIWGVIWNEKLVGGKGDMIPSCLSQPELIQWMVKTGKRLPAGCHLLNHACKLPLCKGVPVRSPTPRILQRYFQESFNDLALLREMKDKLLWMESYPYEAGRRFLEGSMAFYADNLQDVISYIHLAKFPWRAAVIVPEENYDLPTGWSCVGIPAECRQPELAHAVVRFLATPSAQDEFVIGHINVAFCRASNRHLLDVLRGVDEAGLAASVKGTFLLNENSFPQWDFWIARDLRPLFEDVVHGKRSVQEAVESALMLTQNKKMGGQL